ncbi:hypothetical protein DFH07DRAFT_715640, partial [Mycena maculata]
LQDTDAEICGRESAIARLLCEVAELRCRSDQYKAIIHPVRRLPSEILGEVFIQLNDAEATQPCHGPGQLRRIQPYMTEAHPHEAPLIFGREWRAISLSLPRLW